PGDGDDRGRAASYRGTSVLVPVHRSRVRQLATGVRSGGADGHPDVVRSVGGAVVGRQGADAAGDHVAGGHRTGRLTRGCGIDVVGGADPGERVVQVIGDDHPGGLSVG